METWLLVTGPSFELSAIVYTDKVALSVDCVGNFDCCFIAALANAEHHMAHYPQNWKYIMYFTVVREGSSHGHR